MPNHFYEKVDANTIKLWQVTDTFDKTALQDEVTDINTLLALDESEKEVIMDKLLHMPKDEFEDFIDNELGREQETKKDIIDYWDYDSPSKSFDEFTSGWMRPASVYSKCGEDVGNEATLSIDGLKATFWKHNLDESHSIIFDFGYTKRIDKIRIWIPAAPADTYQLSNINVYAAKTIDNLDDNQIGTNLSFQDGDQWNERDLTIKNARYVKVDNIDTAHLTNYMRIREIEFHVRTMKYEPE